MLVFFRARGAFCDRPDWGVDTTPIYYIYIYIYTGHWSNPVLFSLSMIERLKRVTSKPFSDIFENKEVETFLEPDSFGAFFPTTKLILFSCYFSSLAPLKVLTRELVQPLTKLGVWVWAVHVGSHIWQPWLSLVEKCHGAWSCWCLLSSAVKKQCLVLANLSLRPNPTNNHWPNLVPFGTVMLITPTTMVIGLNK